MCAVVYARPAALSSHISHTAMLSLRGFRSAARRRRSAPADDVVPEPSASPPTHGEREGL